MYVVLAILIFGFLIIVHEFGHFGAAKMLGIKVNEFSVCMGPVIFQKKFGETVYSLRCIPIGGFCAMEGENEISDNPRAFTSAKWWKRLIVLIAGAFMNFLVGVLVVAILFSSADYFSTTSIDSFFPDSPVEANGLQVGDSFYSIDGERIYFSTDISLFLSRNTTGTADVVVLRNGKKVEFPEFKIEKREYDIDGESQMLYGFTPKIEKATFKLKVFNSWHTSLNFARMVRLGITDLLTGHAGLDDMGGVVTIVHTMSESGKEAESVSEGIANVFYLAAFIAINLAIMNMLPIPALDGGRVFFLIVSVILEAVLGRKINPKYEGFIHAGGMVLLIVFMIFITFHDLWMLIVN